MNYPIVDAGSHISFPRNAIHRSDGVSERRSHQPQNQIQSIREGVSRCQGEARRFADLSAM